MSKKYSIVFDLDDTICRPDHTQTETAAKYAMAEPIPEMIQAIRELDYAGFHITIHTARRMVTHNGNLAAILDDVGQITTDWLERHDVPYDSLVFGKPYSTSLYVDDKSMNSKDFLDVFEKTGADFVPSIINASH